MIIPEEVKEFIKKCVAEESKYLLDLINDLKKENKKLKTQIAILREGENI